MAHDARGEGPVLRSDKGSSISVNIEILSNEDKHFAYGNFAETNKKGGRGSCDDGKNRRKEKWRGRKKDLRKSFRERIFFFYLLL